VAIDDLPMPVVNFLNVLGVPWPRRDVRLRDPGAELLMPDGGELRASFEGAQEDAAQAVESAAGKMADFGTETAQNVRDSVNTLRDAEGATLHLVDGSDLRDWFASQGAPLVEVTTPTS
jgi:hypothetical protein